MIERSIYTQAAKTKVTVPSQWTDDMYILMNWACPTCGKVYARCTCEQSNFKHVIDRQRQSGYADIWHGESDELLHDDESDHEA